MKSKLYKNRNCLWNTAWNNNACICDNFIVLHTQCNIKFIKKNSFQFDLTTDMVATEVGPGDYFEVKPVIYNAATEDMYVFIQVDMPTIGDRTLYSFNVDSDWSPVSINGGTVVYAYAGSEMTTLQPGDYTSSFTEKMTMNDISYAEYAVIDDINVTITGYAIGTKEISMEPVEAWNQCKGIEESLQVDISP